MIKFLNFAGVSSPKTFPIFTSGLRLKSVIEVCFGVLVNCGVSELGWGFLGRMK